MGLKMSTDQEISRPKLTREEEELVLLYNIQNSKMANRTEEEYCCIACICETTRRERTQLERLALQENREGEGEGEGRVRRKERGGGNGSVDLHPCNIQVVIAVNAPIGFTLSLNLLPCFDRTQEKHEQPGHDYYKYGWIVGASNGLLLCSTCKFYQMEYYITNPLSKKWVALPSAPRVHTYVHVGFIFDRCTSSNFNDHTQTYHDPLHCNACKFKVVRFYDEYQCHQLRSHFEVEIFSSDVGQWTIATVSSPKAFHWNSKLDSPSSFFHKGCLHWVADGGYKIVVYDPYNKKFRGFIRGPKHTQVCQRSSFNIGFSRGSFWLCQVSPTSGYLRFWELKGYDDYDVCDDTFDKCYWNPHRLCHLGEMKGGRPEWVTDECFEKVVAFHPHDPDVVYFQLIIYPDNYVVSCNLRTKTLGPAILKHHGVRFQADIVTLVLPPS